MRRKKRQEDFQQLRYPRRDLLKAVLVETALCFLLKEMYRPDMLGHRVRKDEWILDSPLYQYFPYQVCENQMMWTGCQNTDGGPGAPW